MPTYGSCSSRHEGSHNGNHVCWREPSWGSPHPQHALGPWEAVHTRGAALRVLYRDSHQCHSADTDLTPTHRRRGTTWPLCLSRRISHRRLHQTVLFLPRTEPSCFLPQVGRYHPKTHKRSLSGNSINLDHDVKSLPAQRKHRTFGGQGGGLGSAWGKPFHRSIPGCEACGVSRGRHT